MSTHRLWVRLAGDGREAPLDFPLAAFPLTVAVTDDAGEVIETTTVMPPEPGEQERIIEFAYVPAGMAGVSIRYADGTVYHSHEPTPGRGQ
ncbi:MAG: hypothetical protein ACRDYV_00050 [Acidimicrobiia bacterium]